MPPSRPAGVALRAIGPPGFGNLPGIVETSGWSDGPLLLFHGARLSSARSVLAGIDLGQARRPLDFGPGFYTTTSEGQAWRWAQGSAVRHDPAVVVWFQVDRTELGRLDTLSFVRWTADSVDLWEFIRHCRLDRGPHRPDAGRPMYDMVYGPVSKRWSKRVAHPTFDQVTVHTRRAARLLDRSPKGVIDGQEGRPTAVSGVD